MQYIGGRNLNKDRSFAFQAFLKHPTNTFRNFAEINFPRIDSSAKGINFSLFKSVSWQWLNTISLHYMRKLCKCCYYAILDTLFVAWRRVFARHNRQSEWYWIELKPPTNVASIQTWYDNPINDLLHYIGCNRFQKGTLCFIWITKRAIRILVFTNFLYQTSLVTEIVASTGMILKFYSAVRRHGKTLHMISNCSPSKATQWMIQKS